ncbi:MAG: ParB/RepB/Spo0J family partition protein [Bacteroidales bacterium]|jgi:ParB family chromosome partitioning protein|nr:ParB/RepB/Spo0J family partition protein [Bacteroidales bacterium]NLM93589.1 ParB/RepB/Spo0J family partition protein [Bacteroidales bacterium]
MNAKKRALGKGLSALLDQSGIEPQPIYDIEKDLLPVGTVGKVLLESIESNPYQPRTDFDEEALQDLAASIKEQGVIQPVTVRRGQDGKFQLISGERRCKAARMAGLTEIPAYIIIATDNAMLEMAIVENIQRENLNPIEISLAYKQLIDQYDLTQEMLSERLGKSRSSIANYLRLLNLPGEIQIGLRNDHISMGHARALVSVDDIQTQLDLYQDILAQGLSVREVEEIVKGLGEEEKPEPPAPKPAVSPEMKEKYLGLQKKLSGFYGSKVQVKGRSGGKGSIVINFSSDEDLERILNLIQH